MRCSILPVGSNTINDALRLQKPISCLMKTARRENSVFKSRVNGYCAHCGRHAKLENHHIVPVWVYALRRCIDANLTTFEEWRQFWVKASQGKVTISECNDASNMIRLCVECHREEDAQAFSKWRQHFEDNYPNLFFGIRKGNEMDTWLERNKK